MEKKEKDEKDKNEEREEEVKANKSKKMMAQREEDRGSKGKTMGNWNGHVRLVMVVVGDGDKMDAVRGMCI